jgi:hypothetical protein
MLNIIYLLLAIGLLRLSVAMWCLPLDRGLLKTAALSVAFAACGCLTSMQWLIPHLGPVLAAMGYNVSLYISLPMLLLAVIDWRYDWHWQQATWGRIFLALAALFELLRRADTSLGAMLIEGLGVETDYGLLLAALVMLASGVYLYFAASLMAADSPDTSPK